MEMRRIKLKGMKGFAIGLGMVLMSLQAGATAVLSGDYHCATSDFTTSTACDGIYDPGNDNGNDNIFVATTWNWGTGWVEIDKDESFGNNVFSGDWNVTDWGDTGWEYGEVIGILKAGSHAAAYMMDTNFTSGSWSILSDDWKLGGSRNGMSHVTFYGRGAVNVPEPGTLALMFIGLAGLGFARRR